MVPLIVTLRYPANPRERSSSESREFQDWELQGHGRAENNQGRLGGWLVASAAPCFDADSIPDSLGDPRR
jgi:hypothetical protein